MLHHCHCPNFPYNFPSSHVFSLCKCAPKDKGGERAPITCLSQDDSSGCGKALHPSGHLLSHSPIPSQPPIFPSEGKNRTAGRGNYRTARRSGGESILSLLSPKKHFLGSPVVAQSLSPSLAPAGAGDGWDDAKGALYACACLV